MFPKHAVTLPQTGSLKKIKDIYSLNILYVRNLKPRCSQAMIPLALKKNLSLPLASS